MIFIVKLCTPFMPEKFIDQFLITDAAALSGLTPAMVDYLCRQKVLVPSVPGRRGRGRARKYSFGDVIMLRALSRLLGAGVSVERLKRALWALRPFYKNISRGPLPAKYLATDGRVVFLRDQEGLVDLDGSGQMSFLFVLELESLRRDVL